MQIKNTFKYHLILGLIIISMAILRKYIGSRTDFFANFTAISFLYTVSFYITYFSLYAINFLIMCPLTLRKKKIGYFIIGQLSLVFIFAAIRFFIEELLLYHITGLHNYQDNSRIFWYYIFDNSYYSLQAILLSTFMYLIIIMLKNKDRIHQLELEHKKAELAMLKTQLEPHFLFNTLNVFYSELVISQPETAKGIHKLSKLLRYLTYEAQRDYMPLVDELNFINDYIYFYKKRFENNLFFELNIDGKIGSQKIPSLMLIHFVENIFKHGVINDQNNIATIKIDITDKFLEIKTKNKFSNVKHYNSKGIGSENLIKRLNLLFGNNYNYNFKEMNSFYETLLIIPFKNL